MNNGLIEKTNNQSPKPSDWPSYIFSVWYSQGNISSKEHRQWGNKQIYPFEYSKGIFRAIFQKSKVLKFKWIHLFCCVTPWCDYQSWRADILNLWIFLVDVFNNFSFFLMNLDFWSPKPARWEKLLQKKVCNPHLPLGKTLSLLLPYSKEMRPRQLQDQPLKTWEIFFKIK